MGFHLDQHFVLVVFFSVQLQEEGATPTSGFLRGCAAAGAAERSRSPHLR